MWRIHQFLVFVVERDAEAETDADAAAAAAAAAAEIGSRQLLFDVLRKDTRSAEQGSPFRRCRRVIVLVDWSNFMIISLILCIISLNVSRIVTYTAPTPLQLCPGSSSLVLELLVVSYPVSARPESAGLVCSQWRILRIEVGLLV